MKKLFLFMLAALTLSACTHVSLDVIASWGSSNVNGSSDQLKSNRRTIEETYEKEFTKHYSLVNGDAIFRAQKSYDAKDSELKGYAEVAQGAIEAMNLTWNAGENLTYAVSRSNGSGYTEIYSHTFGDTHVYAENELKEFQVSYGFYFDSTAVDYCQSMTLWYYDIATGNIDSTEILPGIKNRFDKVCKGTNRTFGYAIRLNLKDGVTLPTDQTIPCKYYFSDVVVATFNNGAQQVIWNYVPGAKTGNTKSMLKQSTMREHTIVWKADTHLFGLE